ncbi:MAG: hypothetical protein ACHREM_18215 [Polyangiales bacterium]
MNAPPPPGGFDPRYGAPPPPLSQQYPQAPFVPGGGEQSPLGASSVNVYAPPTAHVTPFVIAPGGYMPFAQAHPGARTALQLAILSMCLCAFVAPFAWYKGLKARDEIRQSPTLYTGESEATAAIWIAGTYSVLLFLGGLVVLGVLVVGIVADVR